MQVNIVCQPDYAMAEVDMTPDEKIVVESGSMVAMTPNLQVETKAKGGLLAGAKRMLGGESFFMNTYTSEGGPGRIFIAPGPAGDMRHIILNNQEMFVQSGSYIASALGVNLDTKWGGAKTFFGGEGLLILKVSGSGDLLFGSFGAIHEVEVDGNYTVDTGHIVAFDSTLTFNIKKVGGLKSLFLSGEGLVCNFTGKGRLYIQTRKPSSFVWWVNRFRPVKRNN